MATDRRNRVYQIIALAIPVVWIVPMMFKADALLLRFGGAAGLALVIYLAGSKVIEYREKYPRQRKVK